MVWKNMVLAIATISFLLGDICPRAAAQVVTATRPIANYESLKRALETYAESRAEDELARRTLIAGGEDTVAVIVDLLLGKVSAVLSDVDVEKIIRELGDNDFACREAATKRLMNEMPGIAPRLQKYKEHEDPEVRWRIEYILKAERPQPGDDDGQLESLGYATTELLEMHMPVEAIRVVAVREVGRLGTLPRLHKLWDHRPLMPLLGSLRLSTDEKDRELLVQVATMGRDGSAELALVVMREGLSNISRRGLPEYWKELPKHDYSDKVWSCLDIKRPHVFREAMQVAARNDRLTKILREALTQTSDEVLKLRIETLLLRMDHESPPNPSQPIVPPRPLPPPRPVPMPMPRPMPPINKDGG